MQLKAIETIRRGHAADLSLEMIVPRLSLHQAAVDATKSPQREAAAAAEASGEFRRGN